MGREVRRVPMDWKHPQQWGQDRLTFKPLLGRSYASELEEFLKDPVAYENPKPDPSDYMPQCPNGAATGYQMYEDCSEGTPISPVMATPEELARWLVDNKASSFGSTTASYEGWLRVAKGGWACSMTITDGVMRSGVDS